MFRTAVLALLLLITLRASAQKDKQYVPMCVGWYNVENLYDTVDAPETDDAEWLPTAPKMWNSERYRMKLDHLARVISEMAKDVHPDGLALLGLCEIENRAVLEDLVKQPALAGRNYQIVHHDGPDRRGVDAAFLYNPKYFKLVNYKAYALINPEDSAFRTREQLVVTGVLDGDTVSCIMAHWPSRRGGEKASQPKRFMAAKLGRHIADSLLAINRNARIMYMGDLNDDPVDPSVRKFFGATEDKSLVDASKFYNPMYSLYQKGIGSLAWGDSWNLFDQVIFSPALANGTSGGFKYYGARVYNQPYLIQPDGAFKGYPFRIYVGDNFTGGYSDHFPVFVILVKEAPQP
jgi:endonuclease/exonuclease/phosphatase family metal-dependent hydrolase